MKRRLLGVTIYGWTVIVRAGIGLYFTWLTVAGAKIDVFKTSLRYALVTSLSFGSLVYERLNPGPGLSIGLNVAAILCGIGVLLWQRWARLLALVLASITLVLLVPTNIWEALRQIDVTAFMIGLSGRFIQFVFGIWTIWYFLRPSVKAQFMQQK